MTKIWKLLCLMLLLTACKDKGSPNYTKPDSVSVKPTDTLGWGKGLEEDKQATNNSTIDSTTETDAAELNFAGSDVVFSSEGNINGFEIKHLKVNINLQGNYEVRLISSNPNLRFVFRENNIDSEANTAYWKGSLAKGTNYIKLFFNADAALAKEKGRYKLYILKL